MQRPPSDGRTTRIMPHDIPVDMPWLLWLLWLKGRPVCLHLTRSWRRRRKRASTFVADMSLVLVGLPVAGIWLDWWCFSSSTSSYDNGAYPRYLMAENNGHAKFYSPRRRRSTQHWLTDWLTVTKLAMVNEMCVCANRLLARYMNMGTHSGIWTLLQDIMLFVFHVSRSAGVESKWYSRNDCDNCSDGWILPQEHLPFGGKWRGGWERESFATYPRSLIQ